MSKKALTPPSAALHFNPLRVQLERLRNEMTSDACLASLKNIQVHECYRQSAENLLQYLCLRRHDLRELQAQLAEIGLSSLGRAEAAILAAVTSVMGVLQRLEEPNTQSPRPLSVVSTRVSVYWRLTPTRCLERPVARARFESWSPSPLKRRTTATSSKR